MIKVLLTGLAVLVLAGCDSDTIYPYMVEKAETACKDNGGLYSFKLNSGANAYTVKARCTDGTHSHVSVPFISLKNT